MSSLAQLLYLHLCNSSYCTITRIHIYMYKYHVLYITNIQVLRDSKLSLLSTCGISYWERSACDLCIAPGGDLWHISYFPQTSVWVKYHCFWLRWSQTSTVTGQLGTESLGFSKLDGMLFVKFQWVVEAELSVEIYNMYWLHKFPWCQPSWKGQ